ncbi:hypothetical protein PIIN_09734 [Serendipita indica DSM 11827]|uniref:Uncharacterized protein n=1 Tax=Serendipita indica (strain DSM 11827) TaxID=1109443 RepID=G4TWQ1_SERID|nr:hypothetical protein PIIN_09734 [Serendipita indica DSM 11827]
MTRLSVLGLYGGKELSLSLPAVISLNARDCDTLSCVQANLGLLQELKLFYEQPTDKFDILSEDQALRTLEIYTEY